MIKAEFISKLLLPYIQIIFSWPTITAIILLAILIIFRKELSSIMLRLRKGHVGGVELEIGEPPEQIESIDKTKKIEPIDELEKYIKEHPKESIQEYLKVFNAYWFERAFNLIYGTQISLLEHLQSKGSSGDNYINLFTYYQRYLSLAISSNTQFADYMKYLVNSNFVEYVKMEQDIIVKITAYGTDFLSYIKAEYPHTYKYKPF